MLPEDGYGLHIRFGLTLAGHTQGVSQVFHVVGSSPEKGRLLLAECLSSTDDSWAFNFGLFLVLEHG